MTLDDKLREILLKGTATFDGDKKRIFWSNDDVIAQIKQAFTDEYLMVKHPEEGHIIIMAGQEWFDRFEKELFNAKGSIPFTVNSEAYNFTLQAARKAAGLK